MPTLDRPGVREWVQAIDRGLDESEVQKLRTPEQLPEISAESFTLVCDFEAGEIRRLIKHEGVPRHTPSPARNASSGGSVRRI